MNLILSEDELKKLPRPIRKEPAITPRIMHLGPGAFFRSFVASLIDEVNQKDVASVKIYLPKKETQKTIINELEKINYVIKGNRNLILQMEDKISQSIERIWSS